MAKQYPRVELYYDNAWQNVTSDVYTRNPIQITRGRGDEQSEPVPSTATLTFNNNSGTYNPRNPSSTLFGKIGRNTPLRISNGTDPALEDNFNRSVTNGWTGGSFPWTLSGGTVPDDYDISGTHGLHTHPSTNVRHYSYTDLGSTDARVRTVGGTAATLTGASAQIRVLARMSDTSNWYSARLLRETSGNTFMWLEKSVAGVLSDVSSSVFIGTISNYSTTEVYTELYVAGSKLYAKAWVDTDPEPTTWLLSATDTSLTTGTNVGLASTRETGNTNANLVLSFDEFLAVAGTLRFTGEVASWTPRRAIKGDAWTDIVATGVQRRLEQGAKPLRSALWRENLTNGPVAMWPMTENDDSSSIGSALPGGSPMTVIAADFAGVPLTPQWEPTSYGYWLESLPTPPIEYRLLYSGRVVMSSSATEWAGDFVFVMSPDITPSGGVAVTWQGTGNYYDDTNPRVDWQLLIGDTAWQLTRFRWTFTSPSSTVIGSGSGTFDTGNITHARLTTVDTGADVDWDVLINNVSIGSGTAASSDWEPLGSAQAIFGATTSGSAAVGFLTAWDTASPPANAANAAAVGRSGELAADRLSRLCDEEGIEFSLVGTASDTEPMGPQIIDTLLAVLQDCENTDMGFLYEPRHQLGLEYRTRTSLYSQTASLEMDFDAAEVAPPLEPVIDDLDVQNDITVARLNGSSVRVTQDTGPLSTQAPPDGVGLYDITIDVNADLDSQLADIAGWRLNLGTVDETRYPRITADLDAVPSLDPDASRLDVGDVLALLNPPDVPDDASLLVPGYTETIGSHRRTITFNCAPASPYRVFTLDTDRLTTSGSTLTNAETSTSTAFELTTASGALWSTTEEPYDLALAGERVTVTTNNDSSSPQDVTVTRSVNGVVKAQTAGEEVQVFQPAVLGL